MSFLKKLIKPLANALDPTPGDLLSGVLFGRIADKTGEDPGVVEKVIGAFKEDPEIVRIRVEGQKALAELELKSQEIASGVLTGMDQRSKDDPRIVQILRGGVRPGSVLLAILVLFFIVVVVFVGGILFSWIAWTAQKISVLEILIRVCMWVVVSLGLGYTSLRGGEKIVSIIKNGSK